MVVPPLVRPAGPSHLGRDIAEGFRWTWGNRAVRTLTVTIVAFNVTYGAAWSVLVLYATQTLDMGPIGFGLLTTVGAVGGIVGTAGYDWLERHVEPGEHHAGRPDRRDAHDARARRHDDALGGDDDPVRLRRARLHLGDDARTVRMRAVPAELQGRVGSLYSIGVFGGIVAGQAVGGVVAKVWGITGPFWFAFAGSAVLLALLWRELAHIAHADEAALAASA